MDCRPDAIEQAESGCFTASDLENTSASRRRRYFSLEHQKFRISPRLRQSTTWRVGDFGAYREAEGWDLILFRNVAIYLKPDYANTIWQRFDHLLNPGGLVVTGSAERPPESLLWKRESPCIYRKPSPLST